MVSATADVGGCIVFGGEGGGLGGVDFMVLVVVTAKVSPGPSPSGFKSQQLWGEGIWARGRRLGRLAHRTAAGPGSLQHPVAEDAQGVRAGFSLVDERHFTLGRSADRG